MVLSHFAKPSPYSSSDSLVIAALICQAASSTANLAGVGQECESVSGFLLGHVPRQS